MQRFFDDVQFKMFLFFNIFSAIGFTLVVIPYIWSENSKSLMDLFLDFLLFYNPAICISAIISCFSGKTKLGYYFFCELAVLFITLH